MARLIAIEGPAAGAALQLRGEQSYLTAGRNGRVRVAHGEPPTIGVCIARVRGGRFTVRGIEPGSGAVRLFVNGAEVLERALPLQHGDLLTYAGATLIFDHDDRGGTTEGYGESPTERMRSKERGPSGSASSESGSSDGGPAVSADSIVYRRKVYRDADEVLARVAAPEAGDSDRLATLLKVAARLGGTLELPALLRSLLDLVFEVVPAARGTILLFDRPTRKLRSLIGKVRGQPAADKAPVPVSRTIIREALRTREAILSLDARQDLRFADGQSIATSGMQSVACVPVCRQDRVLGVIHLDTTTSRPFSTDDVELLAAIAGIASLALENARLFQRAKERERLRSELHLATAIQQRLLPRSAPPTRGLSVSGRMRPAKELGGDLYDFVGEEDGSLHVFVGDVSGKGVGAGLIMAMARSYFRTLVHTHASPRALMGAMNKMLYRDTSPEIFMSGIYLRWDAPAQTLTYCGAGQEHLIIYRTADGATDAVRAGGLALAVVEDATPYLKDIALRLDPGDAVLLYTDGIQDAVDGGGQTFDLHRIRGATAAAGALGDAHAIVTGVMGAAVEHLGAAEQPDDMTVVVLKRLASK